MKNKNHYFLLKASFFIAFKLFIIFIFLCFYLFLNKKKIVNTIIKKIEKQQNIKIHKKDINLKFIWKNLNLGLKVNNINIYDSRKKLFLKAKELHLNINILKLLRKIYSITYLRIIDGYIDLDRGFKYNYVTGRNSNIKIIELENFKINRIINLFKNKIKINDFSIKKSKINFLKKNYIHCNLHGYSHLTSEGKKIENKVLLNFNYDSQTKKVLLLKNSIVSLIKIPFHIYGEINLHNANLHLTAKNKNTILKKHLTIFKKFLKPSLSTYLDKLYFYNPQVEFKIIKNYDIPKVEGIINIPMLLYKVNDFFSLGIKNVKSKLILKNINDLENTTIMNFQVEQIFIDDTKESFNKSRNFLDKDEKARISNTKQKSPFLKGQIYDFTTFDCFGKVDGNVSIKKILKILQKTNISGNILCNLDFSLGLKKIFLEKRLSFQNVNGYVKADNFQINYKNASLKLLKGSFHVSDRNIDNILAIVKLNKSLLSFKGGIHNFLNFFTSEDKCSIYGDFSSDKLDLIEILNLFPDRDFRYKDFFPLLIRNFANVDANIDFEIFELIYFNKIFKKFILNYRSYNKNFFINKFSTYFSGGFIEATSSLKKVATNYLLNLKCNIKRILLDKLFRSCDNFNQNFLEADNLKGMLYSNLDLSTNLDETDNIQINSLAGKVDFLLKGLVLNNFKLINFIKNYIESKNLNILSFEKDIKSTLSIKNLTIYIPSILLKSNFLDFKFSGWHKFDNTINYDIILPLKGNLKIKNNLKHSNKTFLKAFVKVSGHIKKPKINFSIVDTLKDTLSQQTKDLKNIFLGKYKKKKKKGLKNEYFNFS